MAMPQPLANAAPEPQAAPAPKPWWQSKTIILNAVAAALTALEASTGVLKPLVGDNYYAILAVGLPVLNAALRVMTTQPIGKAPSPEAQPPAEGGQP